MGAGKSLIIPTVKTLKQTDLNTYFIVAGPGQKAHEPQRKGERRQLARFPQASSESNGVCEPGRFFAPNKVRDGPGIDQILEKRMEHCEEASTINDGM